MQIIIRLIGLLLFAALLFVGRFGVSAVASDQVVITPITDHAVSRLVVQQSPAALTLRQPADQLLASQPINRLELVTEARPGRQNLAQLPQAAAPQPATHNTCATLFAEVTDMFGRRVTKTETPFTDTALGLTGLDCQLTVVRASSEPDDYVAIAQDLKASLEAAGWREDESYVAYGPSELTLALQQADNSGMLTVRRQAIDSTTCRGDRSTATCLEGSNPHRYQITFSFTLAPLPNHDGVTIIQGTGDYKE